jgi:hypothetical protein
MIATPIQIGPTGPAGANGSSGATGSTGPAGVVAATAPLTYNAGTQTIAIVPASTSVPGSMSAANFAKLDGLPSSIAVDTLAEVLAAGDNADGLPIYNVGVLAAGTVLATLINIEGGSLTLGSGVVLVGDGDNGVGFGGANLTGVGALTATTATFSGNVSTLGNATIGGTVSATDYTGITETIGVSVDGGGTTITTGSLGFRPIAHNYQITSWQIICDQNGSIQFDIGTCTFANYPTTSSIVASAPPLVSSAISGQSSTLTGWTTTLAAGGFVQFSITSATTVTKATLVLQVVRI